MRLIFLLPVEHTNLRVCSNLSLQGPQHFWMLLSNPSLLMQSISAPAALLVTALNHFHMTFWRNQASSFQTFGQCYVVWLVGFWLFFNQT